MLQYNLLPKAVLSLKVLAELPIIVVLMYQLYKQNVHQDVAEFIPLIMATITLQPSQLVYLHCLNMSICCHTPSHSGTLSGSVA